jgi:drug/metabolite transporter (DMT)-like permease
MIGELAALGAALCWTVSAVLYKEALSRTKPIPANVVRCVCTTMVLVACLAFIGKFSILMDLPLYAAVLAGVSGIVGLGLGDTLYMVSLKLIGVARAVPITCTYPLFNLLLAVFLQRETVNAQVLFGTLVIVFGVWLLSREKGKGAGELQEKTLVRGVIYALATAVVWAVSIAMINVAMNLPETGGLEHALAVNTIRVAAVAVFLLASAPVTDREFSFLKMQRKTLAALVFGGIAALALGWFLLTYSFLYTSESQAVPISSTTPLFATVSGIIFLHERVTTKNVAGSILVVFGIFLIFTF